MTEIEELLKRNQLDSMTISKLKEKPLAIPSWGGKHGLEAQYNPTKHPVMDHALYPDIVNGRELEKVTRVTFDYQRLAVKRMTELMTGIPVKRVYEPENDSQKKAAEMMEAIFQRNRIDSVNNERMNMLFAGCEVLTLWYAVNEPNAYYGQQSQLKMRCRNFSPTLGDSLYPSFDEYGDMVAMSVEYTRKVGKQNITFFDTYTKDRHIKWSNEKTGLHVIEDEPIALGKIPAIYIWRPTPIWEDTSKIVYEMEWAMSRNGNYLRKNSKPLFVVFADEAIGYGDEKGENEESRAILQFPQGSNAQYVTWSQAVENLKFYIDSLRNSFFTQLQLPDWSYEKMSSQAMSGESRKQLFIDAQMKVHDEAGRWYEFFDREVNVIRAFMKMMLPESMAEDVDALKVEVQITPFSITDEKETIDNLMTATGGKAIISQRQAIEELGWSADVDKTLSEIAEEGTNSVFEPYQ